MSINCKNLMKLFEFSEKIVKQSSSITMRYFTLQSSAAFKTKLKKDNSPVTEADYDCENYLLKKIKSAYPGHGLLSEESGEDNRSSEFKWIIDPIDGTKNFMRGIPFWGTLLALEYQSEIVIGIISMPALNEFIYAVKGKGCFLNNKPLKVSNVNKIEESVLLYGGLKSIVGKKYYKNFLKLIIKCLHSREFGDCHGHSLIIKGSAEIMIDPKVSPYDIASSKICLEEAGGRMTDLKGFNSIYKGTALLTNGVIHDKILRILNG